MNNLFENLPTTSSEEVFEAIAGNQTVKIERIISHGQTSPATGWYDQAQNEWVVVLAGAAILDFEVGEPVRLDPGDYITLAPHQKHRVVWTDPQQPTLWLAVHY